MILAGLHLLADLAKRVHLLLDLGDLLLEVIDPTGQHGARIAVGPVEFDQVALDAVLELLQPRLQLALGEVLVAVVDRALNLLPSIATIPSVNSFSRRHSSTNSLQTLRIASP